MNMSFRYKLFSLDEPLGGTEALLTFHEQIHHLASYGLQTQCWCAYEISFCGLTDETGLLGRKNTHSL